MKFLRGIILDNSVNCIIARGAPAGIIAARLSAEFKIPFFVESMEPHADYMYESGVWERWDPRYIAQKLGERSIKSRATGIITLTENFRFQLISEDVNPDKLKVVPCVTDLDMFNYSSEIRDQIRRKYNIPPDAIVGINVGKYGGIYHLDKAFQLFNTLFSIIPNFYLFLLTPDPILARGLASSAGLPEERCFIDRVPFNEVSKYLSASDFGFVLVKPSTSRIFCSAIKTGEYWACGLPIIITERVGDDTKIISQSGFGFVWDGEIENIHNKVKTFIQLINESEVKSIGRSLAMKYRNPTCILSGYKSLGLV